MILKQNNKIAHKIEQKSREIQRNSITILLGRCQS